MSGLLLAAITAQSFGTIAASTSAYLQAFTDSPVTWMPWNEATFAEAKQKSKPIFLTIGTATSELSRAMQRQSFSNAETAAFLKENFICIALDAKERPDVAALYQNFLQTLKQVSGPPMNIWLTPELKPFEGANYLPPTEEWGKEGFITTAKRIAAAWKTDADAQRRKADENVAAVIAAQESTPATAASATEIASLRSTATEAARARFDATHGGFGESPKYPEPELLRALLVESATRDMAVLTLGHLIDAPVHDQLDGGFFRYAVDAEWREPYFQKLMIDQPRLALALLDAAKVTGDARFADAARSALTFVLEHLKRTDGDFAAALDATAEDSSVRNFWTAAEIKEVLGEARARAFGAAYGVTPEGNVPEDAYPGITTKGKNLLSRVTARGDAAAEKSLAADRAKLLQHRQSRGAARRDEGATSGTHGLLLAALSRAGSQLSDAALTAAAKAEYAFVRDQLRAKDGSLLRLAHQADSAAPLDYALMIDGLLSFASATGDRDAEKFAMALLEVLNTRFREPVSQRYVGTPADAGAAFWARLRAPTATSGELSSPEAALLTALKNRDALRGTADSLRAIVAADLKNSSDAAADEFLLALSPAP